MNKIVTTRMLAAELPEKARGDIDPAVTVRVTVEEVAPHDVRAARAAMFAELGAMEPVGDTGQGHFARWLAARPTLGASALTVAEAVARVRELRDEQDD